MAREPLAHTIAAMPLVDAHCHPVVAEVGDVEAFALWCTEASVPPPPGVSYLDGQLGAALRRWCAPVLGVAPDAPWSTYVQRRNATDPDTLMRRLMSAAGLATLLVDTGLTAPASPGAGQPAVELLDPRALGGAAGAGVAEVVRLESVAEHVAASGVSAGRFGAAFAETLDARTAEAVAVKSVLAYRHGLDVDPGRPSPREVRAAAGGWLRSGGAARLTDPVLLRHVLWCGVDTGLPIQLHTGFGDRDLSLARADPALLQPFCAAVEDSGVPLVLLHCYPYHRQAGWLAHVYPNVYLDVGLTMTYLGARSEPVLAEFTELAPFGKLLYSSDAYGLPELYLVGAAQFRVGLARLLDEWVAGGALGDAQARRVAELVGAGNARRVYALTS